VSVTLAVSPCDVQVTSGTAVRYACSPPDAIAQLFSALFAVRRSGSAGGGTVQGSPASPSPSGTSS
jgi:hypothetical protein